MRTQVAGAAEDQSAVAKEISGGIVMINDMTERTAARTKHAPEASTDLARLVSELRGLVVQFKV